MQYAYRVFVDLLNVDDVQAIESLTWDVEKLTSRINNAVQFTPYESTYDLSSLSSVLSCMEHSRCRQGKSYQDHSWRA